MEGNVAESFFTGLDRKRREPCLEKVSGTIRFDLRQEDRTDHWFVDIDRGDVSVSREERPADSVVVIDPELFEQIVSGAENGLAAGLRGALTITGNLHLFLMVERLFPSPPDSRGPRRVTRSETRA